MVGLSDRENVGWGKQAERLGDKRRPNGREGRRGRESEKDGPRGSKELIRACKDK